MTTQFRKEINYKDFRAQFKESTGYLKRIAHNTFKYNFNGICKIRLCETDIVIFENDYLILNTGGFYSNLTKDRINNILADEFRLNFDDPENWLHPFIYQNKNIWYYRDKLGENNRFFDGIKVNVKTSKVINKNESPSNAK